MLSVDQMLTLFSRSSTSTDSEKGTGTADTVTRKISLVTYKKKGNIFLEKLRTYCRSVKKSRKVGIAFFLAFQKICKKVGSEDVRMGGDLVRSSFTLLVIYT